MDRRRYFDNAASTFVDSRVLEVMIPFLRDNCGNAHSTHGFGREAMDAVDVAREQVAHLIGAEDPSQITFTSGATESNNWFLKAFPGSAVGHYEHSSIREAAEEWGCPTLEDEGEVESVSHMLVNNETGVMYDLSTVRARTKVLHSDLTQAAGKVEIPLEMFDYGSYSAHKLSGPKGIGALYAKSYLPQPMLVGGGQESDRRAGTLNVPGIVGFGEAAKIAIQEKEQNRQHALALRAAFLDELSTRLTDWAVNGPEDRPLEVGFSPFIVNISFARVLGETLLVELDAHGFAVSTGPACSSGSVLPSHSLIAMGYEYDRARSAIRISFSRNNDLDSTIELARTIGTVVERLRTI